MVNNKKRVFYIGLIALIFCFLMFMRVLLGPLILALLLAYLFDPLLVSLEKRNISRTISAFIIVVLFLVTAFILTWILVPVVYNQILNLSTLLPQFIQYLEMNFFPKMQHYMSNITGHGLSKGLHVSDMVPEDAGKYVEAIVTQLGTSTRFIISSMILIIITPILLFFLLKDIEKIYNFLLGLVPFEILPSFLDLMKEIDRKLKSVILGQVIVISVLCFLYSSFLFFAGLPSAIAVGVLTGMARFIPYLDTLVGSFLCFFVLVTNSTTTNETIISVCIAFATVQCIDGLVITPRIMGKFSDIHPFLVIIAVICFGYWLGFYGVLLAIPATAIGKVLANLMIENYKKSDYYYTK